MAKNTTNMEMRIYDLGDFDIDYVKMKPAKKRKTTTKRSERTTTTKRSERSARTSRRFTFMSDALPWTTTKKKREKKRDNVIHTRNDIWEDHGIAFDMYMSGPVFKEDESFIVATCPYCSGDVIPCGQAKKLYVFDKNYAEETLHRKGHCETCNVDVGLPLEFGYVSGKYRPNDCRSVWFDLDLLSEFDMTHHASQFKLSNSDFFRILKKQIDRDLHIPNLEQSLSCARGRFGALRIQEMKLGLGSEDWRCPLCAESGFRGHIDGNFKVRNLFKAPRTTPEFGDFVIWDTRTQTSETSQTSEFGCVLRAHRSHGPRRRVNGIFAGTCIHGVPVPAVIPITTPGERRTHVETMVTELIRIYDNIRVVSLDTTCTMKRSFRRTRHPFGTVPFAIGAMHAHRYVHDRLFRHSSSLSPLIVAVIVIVYSHSCFAENYISKMPGVGLCDGESSERFFAKLRHAGTWLEHENSGRFSDDVTLMFMKLIEESVASIPSTLSTLSSAAVNLR